MSPLMIDSADFSQKLGLISRNVEHTEAFLARVRWIFICPDLCCLWDIAC
jgi:hypothetical protein